MKDPKLKIELELKLSSICTDIVKSGLIETFWFAQKNS